MIRMAAGTIALTVLLSYGGWLRGDDEAAKAPPQKDGAAAEAAAQQPDAQRPDAKEAGQERPAKERTAKKGAEKDGPEKKRPEKLDPAAMAFKLPKGFVLAPEEKLEYEQLQARLEPKLRQAMQTLKESKDRVEKRNAAKEVAEIRSEIKATQRTILQQRQMKMYQAYAEKLEQLKKQGGDRGRARGGRGRR